MGHISFRNDDYSWNEVINSSLSKQPLPKLQQNSYTGLERIETVYALFYVKEQIYDRNQKRIAHAKF